MYGRLLDDCSVLKPWPFEYGVRFPCTKYGLLCTEGFWTAVLERIKRKRSGRKPVSVFKSAIYLRNLPPGIGRAALICRYIWFCRPRWRTRSVSLPCVVSSCLAFSPLTSRELSETASVRRRLFSVTPCLKLPPPALSAAGCPSLSGLSSAFRPRQIVRPDSL